MNIALRDKVIELLGQQSTWQGLAFLIALSGGHFAANLDWGQAAALGGTLSALLKTLVSDTTK
jgi:urea transporter